MVLVSNNIIVLTLKDDYVSTFFYEESMGFLSFLRLLQDLTSKLSVFKFLTFEIRFQELGTLILQLNRSSLLKYLIPAKVLGK